jgi:hypothetical protein
MISGQRTHPGWKRITSEMGVHRTNVPMSAQSLLAECISLWVLKNSVQIGEFGVIAMAMGAA